VLGKISTFHRVCTAVFFGMHELYLGDRVSLCSASSVPSVAMASYYGEKEREREREKKQTSSKLMFNYILELVRWLIGGL
jgi:hypothetical protein